MASQPAAAAPPLLFAAVPGVLAAVASDADARHAVTAQLLTASEGGEVAAVGAPLRVAAGEGDALTPLAGGRAADARTGRRHAYCALLQRGRDGADVALRLGRLAPSAADGWAAPRWVHLTMLPLPPGTPQPDACHVIDGPLLLLALPDGCLFVAAPRAPPRAAADALQARASGEAPPGAWRGGTLRFNLPPAAPPPALLLAAWRLARGGGPAALLALRGVPPPGDDVEGPPGASSASSSFALVPLLDALRRDDAGREARCGAATLARYQRAAAALAPHSLAEEAVAACAVPVPPADGDADAVPEYGNNAADDVALALRGGRVLRLRRGAVAAEGGCKALEDGGAASLFCVPLTSPRGAALLAVARDWRASAVALCARTLRGGAVAADVAAALPLLGPPSGNGGGGDVASQGSPLCAAGAALLLPRGLDAASGGGPGLTPLRAAEGPAWAKALRGAATLSLPAALAAAAPPPPATPGARAVAAALAARVAAARDAAAQDAQRLTTAAEAAAAARALLARCSAAACAAMPPDALLREADADADDEDDDDVAGGNVHLEASLRGAFRDGEWRVAADVAMASDAAGAQLRDVALALLPPAGGNTALRGRAGVAAQPLRAGGPRVALAVAAPASAVAAACGDGPALVMLTGRLIRPPHPNDAAEPHPGDSAGVPFAALLQALQPRWADAGDAAAEAADGESVDDDLLPGWRRDALLTCRGADLRAAPRALCAALRLAPDATSSSAAGGTAVVLRPMMTSGARSALPAGCAVRLAPRGAERAELTLTAARRADGLRLARHVAAALPADACAWGPNAAAPPALEAAAALAEALRAEIRAALAAAEGEAPPQTGQRSAAALAADSSAALAALLLATAQD